MSWPPPPDYPAAGPATRIIAGIAGLVIALYFVLALAPGIAADPALAAREPGTYLGIGFLCLFLWPFWFVASGRINTAKAPAWLKYPRWFDPPRRRILKLVIFSGALVWMAWSTFTESRSVGQWVRFGLSSLILIGYTVVTIRSRDPAVTGR